MMFMKVLSSLVLGQLVVAQYGGDAGGGSTPTSSAPASAPSAPANSQGHINIDVFFNQTYTFHPANVSANPGDIVTFFFPTGQFSHSVTQSSFNDPCTHLAANGSNSAGFDSGLQLAVTFSLNITDTNPIWFHCKQVGHCGMGMVGSINAPATGNTYDAFVQKALAIGPSETTEPDSGTPVLTGVGAVATGPPGAGSGSSSSSSGAENIVVKGGLYLAIAGVVMWMT